MADQLQLRGGTTNEHSTFTGALREVTVDTDKDTLIVHDAATAGGHPLAKEDLSNVPTGTITSTMIADGTIVNADINASAEIAVSKLADGAARQLLQTDAAGTGVEWTNNVDVPGTLDVTSVATFDNIASHSLGAAATPSITFTGDTNTGIYSPGADQVAISTGGSGRLFVDASGRVGVGTTSPAKTFEVNGTAALKGGSPYLYLTQTSATGQSRIYFGDPDTELRGYTTYDHSDDSYRVATASNERLRIDSSGRLLLGVSNNTSGARLQVEGLTAGDGVSIRRNQAGSAAATLTVSKSRGTANGSFTSVANGDTLGTVSFRGADGTGDIQAAAIFASVDGTPGTNDMPGRLVFSTTADGASTATERMRIDSSGRVGVGTTSPGSKLHVYDGASGGTPSANAKITIEDNNNAYLNLLVPSAYNCGVYFGDNDDADIGYINYNHGSNYLAFGVNAGERLRIDSNGRVGIGTSTPDSSLTITKDAAVGLSIRSADTNFSSLLFGVDTSSGFNFITSSNSGSGAVRPLSFRIGGSEALHIDTSNRVGIGVTPASWGSSFVPLQIRTAAFACQTGARTAEITSNLYNNSGWKYIDSDFATSYYQYNGEHIWTTAASGTAGNAATLLERAKIDSSGRLLVGTTATSLTSKLIVKARTDDANGNGGITLQRGSGPSAANQLIGAVQFTDNSDNYGAVINAESEGAWTGGSSQPTRLGFYTTASSSASLVERMRIGANGQIDTFWHSQYGLVVNSSRAAGTGDFLIYGRYSATNTLGSGGTNSFRVSTNGNVTNTNNSYGAISDIKLKENIVDASSQWNDLKAIQVRNYNFKEGQTHTQLGVVAQEVELVSPGLVTESPDIDEEGNDLGTTTKSVNYSVLYMKAVKALQEAMERIETLEAKVAALEAN